MKLEKWMTKLEKHFNSITREQFIKNLNDCGLGEIKDINEDDASIYEVENKYYYYLRSKNDFSSLDSFQSYEGEVA